MCPFMPAVPDGRRPLAALRPHEELLKNLLTKSYRMVTWANGHGYHIFVNERGEGRNAARASRAARRAHTKGHNMSKSRKLKSHTKLRIHYRTYAALLAVRELLKIDAIKHNPTVRFQRGLELGGRTLDVCPLRFNMTMSAKTADCGTVACIGGHMALVLGDADPDVFVTNAQGALRELFYPLVLRRDGAVSAWNEVTPRHAVKAIDNYLTTGRAQWHKIVPKSWLSLFWRGAVQGCTYEIALLQKEGKLDG